MKFEGKFQDTIITSEGVIVTPWSTNQAQDGWALIASQLFCGTNAGFSYLALGEGESSWDITPPTKDQTQLTLENEIDRIPINTTTDIQYLDPDTEAASGTPTRMIEISVLIDFARGIGDLREFGLIVGDTASSSLNTGVLFNWVSHNLRTKTLTTPTQILRKIRIKFKVTGE